jgi:hypothetical protein
MSYKGWHLGQSGIGLNDWFYAIRFGVRLRANSIALLKDMIDKRPVWA